jgi:hypothetical protein
MFGGVMGSIVGNVLLDALLSDPGQGAETAAQHQAQQQAAAAEAARAEALRQAVEEQKRMQEARESQFFSTLLDRPATQLIGTGLDMTVLENARAAAGQPFDGGGLTDPHGTWMSAHDAWFSPEGSGAATSGSSPAGLDGWPLPKSSGGLRPVECMGRVCGFPRTSPPAATLRTIPKPATKAAPGPSVKAGGPQSVTSEWRETGDRVLWAARQRFEEAAQAARARETQAEILSYGWVRFGEGALPGMQREVAREGRGIYQRTMENLLSETMEVMSDAFAGRWHQALDKSDTIGERVKESLLSEYKMSRLLLAGDARGAGEVAGDAYWGHAKEVAGETVKDGLLDRLGGPEWLQEGARASADVSEHWLKTIFKGKGP